MIQDLQRWQMAMVLIAPKYPFSSRSQHGLEGLECWYMDLKVPGSIPSNPQIFNNIDGAGGSLTMKTIIILKS